MQAETGTPLNAAATSSKRSHGDGAGAPGASIKYLVLVALVAAIVVLADQSSKAWAVHALRDGNPRDFLGSFLRFQLTFNPGAAFSLGTNSTLVITGIAIVVVVVLALSARRLHSYAWASAFGLIIGGALGNLGDRFFRSPGSGRGHVVDFLQLPHWPIFNLADSAICCAAALIVVLSFRGVGLDGVRDSDRASGENAEAEKLEQERP